METFPFLSPEQCIDRLFSTATYSGLSIGTHYNNIDSILNDYKLNSSDSKYENIKNIILGNNYGNPIPKTFGGKKLNIGNNFIKSPLQIILLLRN